MKGGEFMTPTQGRPKREDGRNAKTAANNKYSVANYDRINFYIKKGEKEKVKKAANDNGETVNTYINRIISENIPDFDPLKQENALAQRKKEKR